MVLNPIDNPNEDTEFNDILRKHGILPQKEALPPSPSPPPSPTLDDLLDDFTPDELQELGEEAHDAENERMIAMYRRQRIADLKTEENKARFGRVYPIGREDYTREVTEASRIDEPGDGKEQGTGVVCFLYKDGIARSERTSQHISALATRYPRSKFVSIVGDKCIPNLPDSRLPMIIVYRKGGIRHQVVAWGSDRERRIEELEALLIMCGGVDPSDVKKPTGAHRDDDESDGEDSDDLGRRRPAPKNIRRAQKVDDSDSELDI